MNGPAPARRRPASSGPRPSNLNFGIQASTEFKAALQQGGLSQWPESHLPVGPGPGKSKNNLHNKKSDIWNYVEVTLLDFLIFPSRDHLSNVQTKVGCRSNESNPGHVERSKPHYHKYCGCRCCEPKNGNQNQKTACCTNQWVIFRERLVQIAAQELAKVCRDASEVRTILLQPPQRFVTTHPSR